MNITELDRRIKQVCPIHGVAIGRVHDKATWRISFKDEATAEQKTAAAGVVASFDPDWEPAIDDKAATCIDAIDRLQFEVLFDVENRVRTLEGKAAITRAQYRTALINRWKALNP